MHRNWSNAPENIDSCWKAQSVLSYIKWKFYLLLLQDGATGQCGASVLSLAREAFRSCPPCHYTPCVPLRHRRMAKCFPRFWGRKAPRIDCVLFDICLYYVAAAVWPFQERTRRCLVGHVCEGYNMERRVCNSFKCQGIWIYLNASVYHKTMLQTLH